MTIIRLLIWLSVLLQHSLEKTKTLLYNWGIQFRAWVVIVHHIFPGQTHLILADCNTLQEVLELI